MKKTTMSASWKQEEYLALSIFFSWNIFFLGGNIYKPKSWANAKNYGFQEFDSAWF
jgi:hypothetical protein